MMFRLNLTLSGGFFAVPNEGADKHMLLATEKQLKTLMLMLRNPEQTITPDYIADKLKISSSDARDHLMYWAEQGVISGCGEAAVPSSVQKGK